MSANNGTKRRDSATRAGRPVRRIDVFQRVSVADDDRTGPGWLLLNRHEGPGMTAEKALRLELELVRKDPSVAENGLVFFDGDLLVGVLRDGARGPELIDLERE